MSNKREDIVKGLQKAYWDELETVMNYMANSFNLDGIRAEEIKSSLSADVQEELGHAQMLAKRIRELDGSVEGSFSFKARQTSSQPPEDSTDVLTVIKGVIDAEQSAIEHYKYMIKLTDGEDYVTQDICVTLLADEEAHLREFKGFLKAIEAGV
jgi:bacterioferritin